jgi:hypothetical protein
MTDEQIEQSYRLWWAASWGTPPNAQAVATAVAFGRHLLEEASGGQRGAAVEGGDG